MTHYGGRCQPGRTLLLRGVTSVNDFTRELNQGFKKCSPNVSLAISRCQEIFFMFPSNSLHRLPISNAVDRLLTRYVGPLTMRPCSARELFCSRIKKRRSLYPCRLFLLRSHFRLPRRFLVRQHLLTGI